MLKKLGSGPLCFHGHRMIMQAEYGLGFLQNARKKREVAPSFLHENRVILQAVYGIEVDFSYCFAPLQMGDFPLRYT